MEAYVGEIRAVGFNYAPNGWAMCQGQIMQIRTNSALFAILGTTYGGNGSTTFALPNLCGRAIVNTGQGPGLSQYPLGAAVGVETETLLMTEMPPHVHTLGGQFLTQAAEGSLPSPAADFLATTTENQYSEGAGTGTMAANMLKGTAGPVGGNQPHSNLMPYLALNYIICLTGVFPPRG